MADEVPAELGNEAQAHDLTEDDPRKVFVSRIPRSYDDDKLWRKFEKAFGREDAGEDGVVESASVAYDEEMEQGKGYGFVVFRTVADRDRAVEAGVVKSKRKHNMHIRPVQRGREGRGRDDGICFLWKRFSCTHGDRCRFQHTGDGGCIKPRAAGAPGATGKVSRRNRCFAFAKGKCKRGDACPFAHVAPDVPETCQVATSKPRAPRPDSEKPCINWKTKGKCRKGDACPYLHDPEAQRLALEKKARRRAEAEAKREAARQRKKNRAMGGAEAAGTTDGKFNVTIPAKDDGLNIRVFGLNYETTEEDIRTFFAECGRILAIEMPRWEDSGRSKGFCGIRFRRKRGVEAALLKDGEELLGRWLAIQQGLMFSSWEEQAGKKGSAAAKGAGKKRDRNARDANDGSGDTDNGTSDPCTVFIGNLDWQCTRAQLRSALEASFGAVKKLRMRSTESQANQGFAHVTFASEDGAKKCVEADGTILCGRAARMDFVGAQSRRQKRLRT